MIAALHDLFLPRRPPQTKKQRPWGVHVIGDLIAQENVQTQLSSGGYGRSVAEPFYGNRLQAAWWVLSGRAQAIVWPTCEELNAAIKCTGHGSRHM